KVDWVAPNANSYPISGYTVTLSPGGLTANTNNATFTKEMYPVDKGTQYMATVIATNALGNSPGATAGPVTATCTSVSTVLYAVDNCNVQYGGAAGVVDANLIVSKNTTSNSNLISFLKFNLGGISAWAKIESLKLNVKAFSINNGGGGAGHPSLEVWYSQD